MTNPTNQCIDTFTPYIYRGELRSHSLLSVNQKLDLPLSKVNSTVTGKLDMLLTRQTDETDNDTEFFTCPKSTSECADMGEKLVQKQKKENS